MQRSRNLFQSRFLVEVHAKDRILILSAFLLFVHKVLHLAENPFPFPHYIIKFRMQTARRKSVGLFAYGNIISSVLFREHDAAQNDDHEREDGEAEHFRRVGEIGADERQRTFAAAA